MFIHECEFAQNFWTFGTFSLTTCDNVGEHCRLSPQCWLSNPRQSTCLYLLSPKIKGTQYHFWVWVCVYICMYVCASHVCRRNLRSKQTSDLLELKLLMVVRHCKDSGNRTQVHYQYYLMAEPSLQIQGFLFCFVF